MVNPYFKDRSNGRGNINPDGYQVVQLKSCIQFDGVNCDFICLKVLRLCIPTCIIIHVIVVTWARVICLICMPKARELRVYISGKSRVLMLQLICNTLVSCAQAKS